MPSRWTFSGHRPESRVAIPASHRDDGELPFELDELLGELVGAEQLRLTHETLPFAVVAEPSRLHECRQAGLLEGGAEAGRRDAKTAEELLLTQPVLPLLQSLDGPGSVRNRAAESSGTFSNSKVTAAAPSPSRSSSAGSSYGPTSSSPHPTGARIRTRVEEAEAQPERDPCQREHPAELPAADAGDQCHGTRRASQDTVARPSGRAVTRRGRARRAQTWSARPGTRGVARGSRGPSRRGSPPRAGPR